MALLSEQSYVKDSLRMKYLNIQLNLSSNIHNEIRQQEQQRHQEVLRHQHVQRHERVLRVLLQRRDDDI